MKKFKFLNEFKKFLTESDAVSLAVGVIIGAAMKDLVTSLVDNIFNPIIGLAVGKVDFSSLKIEIGSTAIRYGAFLTSLINFVIMAFVVFLIVKAINTFKDKFKALPFAKEEAPEVTTKICPYCQSEISIKATRCPHCTSELE